MDAERGAYGRAGVDVAAGDRAVELMRAAVESTRRPEVVGGLGGFAAAVGLPGGLRDPLLVSATDGVGTKTALAAATGRWSTIGIDLVAMCADDVVCTGAAPLFFLDYVAVGRVVPERIAELVGSVAVGCRTAGCALVGGETAEHPGLMAPDEFDLAGFCVGIVERDRVLDGSGIRAGDAVVGIAASGLHANGFSLVRALVAEHRLDLAAPYAGILAAAGDRIGPEPELGMATLGEALLVPTRIYARTLLSLRDQLDAAGTPLGGLAHVTGGGLPGNLPRMLPDGLGVRVDPGTWPVPSSIRLVAALGSLDGAELRATLNAGIGMAVALPRSAVAAAIARLAADGMAAWRIGEVVPVEALGGARYGEGPLAS
ncbi:MAG: phosphoribosyl formylglycinamidine cyclo-ligase [Chloroflexota bacterium]